MNLPQAFQFSQSNLQDYVDCRRRFQLRHLLKVAWPALESQPVQESERLMRQGARFHRMLQQVFTGVPIERISALEMEADLAGWWSNFQIKVPSLLDFELGELPQPELLPEISLAAPLGDHRILAKYDLIVNRLPGKITIVDWKTSSRAPRREKQAARIQTQLYPYLLVQAGAQWNGGQPLQPEQVEMLYWYAAEPDKLQRFSYDQRQYERDQSTLLSLTNEIVALSEDAYSMTPREERCKYCRYRSLCDRGIWAGALDAEIDDVDLADTQDFALDFEQIAEIEF
jgi:CRISPR/Cas system-associated exonuclease Cas4 (RecB family)